MSDDYFDSDKAVAAIGRMWRELAEQIATAVPTVVIDNDDPERAILWATCAEACFWKATGEAEAHDIKDVIGPSKATPSIS